MKIIDVRRLGKGLKPGDLPEPGLPEIAFAGRSNVGKSSLINHLVRRKKLAQTSSTPGRTRQIHFFVVNEQFILVDLPGYGYTKAPPEVNARWRQSMDKYFRERETLQGVIQLVDIRHPPTAMDKRVNEWLRSGDLLLGVAATKADKITRSRLQSHIMRHRRELEIGEEVPLIFYSTVSGDGRRQMLALIERAAGL